MEHTYEEIRHMTVAQLREIAEGIENEELRGYKSLKKGQLIPLLCKVLGIEEHVHHEVVGINKSQIKLMIREAKVERDAALEVHDRKQLKVIRRKIHRLKRRIHKATV